MAKSERAAFNAQLAAWRRERFDEMEANLRVWKEIRDDSKEDAKNRNEAAKNIAKALGGLGADKSTPPPAGHTGTPEGKEEGLRVSEEEMARINSFLATLNGPNN